MTSSENVTIVTGMTLRDQFALAALQGMSSQALELIKSKIMSGHSTDDWCSEMVRICYTIADEMIKAREK